MTAPSAARRALSKAIAARGANGTLLISHALGETLDGPDLPPGSQAYPPCRCPLHRTGQGHPDVVLRQEDRGPEGHPCTPPLTGIYWQCDSLQRSATLAVGRVHHGLHLH
ncbi:hypothetical protein GCM10010319_46170 [Streptomyces blastmyceticus]|uniref:Uncharacterized protein n=1 Tax=Streptomyces blastmyceticus TaxID=68180 RepID=A0ABP3HAW9_9ACTN